ncbi:glycosyl hydrolase family 43 protein [Lasiosphaeria miniovina]|uniref:Glycosyl hydrolase family 43 protein n=1 Tax=Lasiosphaeria miniovina TaxID=1954250 RepID=A0AA40B625_9PEZI|nr:glycosyl hydrolase family 43 protein [Lasiosphaeria miniovina]KAK0728207.1 glycosyl hydrolase family 43 protein [Lasiosphaeria miniovina]
MQTTLSEGRLTASGEKTALMKHDFPDPSLMQDSDGTWYSFATTSGGKNIQAARADAPGGPWTYVDQDMLPDTGAWTTGRNSWAPDVSLVATGLYIMYYSGELGNNSALHCVGTATSSAPLGPYTAAPTPLACPVSQGGAIDPAGFVDAATGRRYVVYKVDGNALGHGGSCNNGVEPYVATPIMLQEVSADDGVTAAGDPVRILDRSTTQDGPLVEAPNLARSSDGTYVLFYSNHCWDTPGYSINYATASAVAGPYTKSGTPLVATGDYNLTAPGGATSTIGDAAGSLVFHANCPQGRCLGSMAVGHSTGVYGTVCGK